MAPPAALRPSDDELRRLYLDERMTTRTLAGRFQVQHITIQRWLRAAGIPRRAPGRGLDHRGTSAPTAGQLHTLVHVEHRSYHQIAELYGVDATAVPYWLTKHGIPRPAVWDTRRKGVHPALPPSAAVRRRYEDGESLANIGEVCGVSADSIRPLLLAAGGTPRRDGWNGGKRFTCRDGHLTRSTYEQRVDDWLTEHGLAHEVEPTYPWDRRYHADFLVGQTYIEVWGVIRNERYQQRKAMKIGRCRETGLDLIQINHWQFATGQRWWRRLQRLENVLDGVAELPF